MTLRKRAWKGLAPFTILVMLVAMVGFVALPASAATLTAEADYTFVVGDALRQSSTPEIRTSHPHLKRT